MSREQAVREDLQRHTGTQSPQEIAGIQVEILAGISVTLAIIADALRSRNALIYAKKETS